MAITQCCGRTRQICTYKGVLDCPRCTFFSHPQASARLRSSAAVKRQPRCLSEFHIASWRMLQVKLSGSGTSRVGSAGHLIRTAPAAASFLQDALSGFSRCVVPLATSMTSPSHQIPPKVKMRLTIRRYLFIMRAARHRPLCFGIVVRCVHCARANWGRAQKYFRWGSNPCLLRDSSLSRTP